MATLVRTANLEEDRGLLIDSIRRWLAPEADERRFDWLYKNGPHGQAQALIATQGTDGPLIGAAAVFPRRMCVGNETKMGCVLGDFFILPEHRSLGPAVQLQRACLKFIQARSIAFWFDFPGSAMLPVYKRLSIAPTDRLARLAKLLRADQKISQWVKAASVTRGLSAAENRVLAARDRRHENGSGCDISLLEGPCGQEFTALVSSVCGRYGIAAQRCAEYLNWRYRNHFAQRYEFLVARREAKLLAYLVYRPDAENAEIVDLFGVHDIAVFADLINAAVALLRKQGVFTVSLSILASHPFVTFLEKLGFRERDSCPVILHDVSKPEGETRVAPWFLMQGDRES